MPNVAKIISSNLITDGVNNELYPYKGNTTDFIGFLKQAKIQSPDAYILLGYDKTEEIITTLKKVLKFLDEDE